MINLNENPGGVKERNRPPFYGLPGLKGTAGKPGENRFENVIDRNLP
jgi:hypothetical protein